MLLLSPATWSYSKPGSHAARITSAVSEWQESMQVGGGEAAGLPPGVLVQEAEEVADLVDLQIEHLQPGSYGLGEPRGGLKEAGNACSAVMRHGVGKSEIVQP